MQLYYLSKDNEWVSVSGLLLTKNDASVINFEFNLDEETDKATLLIKDDYNTPIFTPNTIFKLVIEDEPLYYVLGDSKKDKRVFNNEKTLVLKEPIELTKDYKVEPISFYPNRYTFFQVLARLNTISKFNWHYNYQFTIDPEWRNPRFTFKSSNLYNILFEIGRTIDRVPELLFNETLKKWQLHFSRMDGLNRPFHDESIFNYSKHREEYIDGGIAKSVYGEVQNLVGSIETTYPSAEFGTRLETFDINDPSLTMANAVFRVPENIREIVEFRIYGYIDPSTGSDLYLSFNKENDFIATYYAYQPNPPYPPSITTHHIRLVDKRVYDTLEDKSGYIYYDGNIIDFRDFEFEFDAPHVNRLIDQTNPDDGKITFLLYTKMALSYIPLSADALPFEASNDFDIKRTVFYNQNETLVDADRLASNFKSYIGNMGSLDLLKSGKFASWLDIPKKGDNVIIGSKRYVFCKISITPKLNGYDAIFQLNENHTRRSEFIGADTSYMLYDVPNNDIVDRLTLERDVIDISIIDSINNKNNSRLFGAGFETALNLLTRQSTKTPTTVAIRFRTGSLDLQYILDTMTMIVAGNNLMLNIKAEDNRVYGRKLDKTITQLYTYTTELGETPYFYMKICEFPFAKGTVDFDNAISDFPITNTSTYYQIEPEQTFVNMQQYDYSKDAFERFNFTYQLEYKGVKGTVVSANLVKEISRFKDTLQSIRLGFYNTNFGEFDEIPSLVGFISVSSATISTVGGRYKITLNHASFTANNIRAISVYGADLGKIFLIKNFDSNYNYSSNKLDIYINFEKGV